MPELKRVDPYRLRLEPGGKRLIPAMVCLPEGLTAEDGAVKQLAFERSMEGVHLICADRAKIKEEAPDEYKDIDHEIETVVGASLA